MPQVMGKPGKMDWKSFVGRRRLNVGDWIVANRFNTYKDLTAYCEAKHIEAPPLRAVKQHFVSARPKTQSPMDQEHKAKKAEEKVVEEKKVEEPKSTKRRGRKKVDRGNA